MTTEDLKLQTALRSEEITLLQFLWEDYFPEYPIREQQLHVWLDRHSIDNVVRSVRTAGRRHLRRGCDMSFNHVVCFASQMMNMRSFGPNTTRVSTPAQMQEIERAEAKEIKKGQYLSPEDEAIRAGFDEQFSGGAAQSERE